MYVTSACEGIEKKKKERKRWVRMPVQNSTTKSSNHSSPRLNQTRARRKRTEQNQTVGLLLSLAPFLHSCLLAFLPVCLRYSCYAMPCTATPSHPPPPPHTAGVKSLEILRKQHQIHPRNNSNWEEKKSYHTPNWYLLLVKWKMRKG